MPGFSASCPTLDLNFLAQGVMSDLIRSKDWSSTPLGPIGDWPQSLRTTVSLCLASNFPINIIWGPNHVQIYNDGYRPICAAKHPRSLGEDYRKSWATAWDSLREAFDSAVGGQTAFLENQRMFLDRNGYLEETFFTFCLSPIRDEAGQIGGLFHPVTETTSLIINQRRTRALQDLASLSNQSKSVPEACKLSLEALAPHRLDLPFVLIYLLDPVGAQVEEAGRQYRLAASAHLEPGAAAAPELLALESPLPAWPLAEVIRTGAAVQVDDLPGLFGPLGCGPYPESPQSALVLPVSLLGADQAAGFVVAGVSPRLPFTADYRSFLSLVASGIAASFANARMYDQERQRAEKLAELDRAKTVFFSNVSHEFRTPLTLMLGPLEQMLSHPEEQITVQRHSLDLIHRNGLRLLRLVNALLDFSRVEAKRTDARYEPVDLAALTRNLASVFRSAIERAGLTFQVDCPELSQPIYVDQDMWEKIVLNLLSNAFKFTLSGTIGVALRERSNQVQLAVSDTGVGIPAGELSKVCTRFYRVQGTQGRTYEGTGIGLALVQDLVELHGGKIETESVLGTGATFRVTIPTGSDHLPAAHVADAATRSETQGRNAGMFVQGRNAGMFVKEALGWLPSDDLTSPLDGLSGESALPSTAARRRVLLVDDNADMRHYIRSILTPEFQVESAANGKQALAAARARKPDLVLTDVMMPEVGGLELLHNLRHDLATSAIPVIMLSARTGEEARTEGLEAGADDYLEKPFSASELLARVRGNLQLAGLRHQLATKEEEARSALTIERQWRLFDTALSNTPESIFLSDRECRLTYANAAFLKTYRISLPQAQGRKLSDVVSPPGFALQIEDHIREVIASGVPRQGEASLLDQHGKTRSYNYVLTPASSAGQPLEAVAVSAWDVTEHVKINRALREANTDLEQFAYSASHDLRAPLRAIEGVSRLLEVDLSDHFTGETREYFDLLQGRVKRMGKMLDDLMEYARIGKSQNSERNKLLTGAALLRDVLAMLTLDGFSVKISPGFASVLCYRMPLQQIFLNLIGNAIKHHHRKEGLIEVTVEKTETHYVFGVKDDGPGIPAEYQEQIFQLFQTLKPRDQVEGSGMGLAMARKYIEACGGKITVESYEGKGSTFRFTWPKDHSDSNK